MAIIPFLRKCLLALRQNGSLAPNICQSTNDLSITIHKAVQGIWNLNFSTEFLDQLLRPS